MILGVLTGEQNVRSPYVRAILNTARELGVVSFSFTARALIDEQLQFIQGYGGSFARNQGIYAFPTVVYNRIPTRKEEVSQGVERVKAIFRKRSIAYFNERFFNKREVDLALRKYSDTVSFLPETLPEWDASKAATMLARYGCLYVKPISGSFGEGICQISRSDDKRYCLDVRGPLGVVTHYYNEWAECLHACKDQLGGYSVIIQEGISLKRFTDCKTDFRVHMHKGQNRKWHAVCIGAKVANRQAITTHKHSGGRVEDGQLVLRTWFGRDCAKVREKMEMAAEMICEHVTAELDSSLGELGLDMGIADDGRIILFEVNAKPGRAIFQHRALRAAGHTSRLRVFEHAQALLEERLTVVPS